MGSSKRIAGLDGVRAAAILWVLALHLIDSGTLPRGTWFASFAQHGAFGVKMFFVLSGFLITQMLLEEEASEGRIGLRRFYLKRAFRILPPALVLMVFTWFMAKAGFVDIPTSDYVSCLFMVHNIYFHASALAHFWSLSIEEQFYFFFPLILLAVRSWKPRAAILAFLVLATPPWYVYNIRHGIYPLDWRTDFNLCELAMGCLLALLCRVEKTERVLKSRFLQSDLAFAGLVAALFLTFAVGDWAWNPYLRPVRAVLIALMINFFLTPRKRIADRIFGWAPVVVIGQLSYSIYLWQQFFVREPARYWFQTLPYSLLIVLGFSALSYRFIEKPALRLRNRLLSKTRPPASYRKAA